MVGGSVALTGATPTLTATQVNTLGKGVFQVSLVVTDGFGATSPAATTTSISVKPQRRARRERRRPTVGSAGRIRTCPTQVRRPRRPGTGNAFRPGSTFSSGR